ncbi:hypothetical protein [Luteitalea sp.]
MTVSKTPGVGVVAVVLTVLAVGGGALGLHLTARGAQPAPVERASVVARGGEHAYFDDLVARKDHWKSYSLCDPKQLHTLANGGYSRCNKCDLAVTYAYAEDRDARRQDAARLVIPEGTNSLPNQVRLPLGTENGHTYLVTWEAWYGAEFHRDRSGIRTFKTFQFSSNSPRDSLWAEVRTRISQATGTDIGLVDMRAYGGGKRDKGRAFGPSVRRAQPLEPAKGTFSLRPETWTRYWWQIQQRADDFDLVSLWVADTERGPVQLIDNLELNTYGQPDGVQAFWIEFNTSKEEMLPNRGPLVAYVRNVVVLRDPGDLTPLLIKPRRK